MLVAALPKISPNGMASQVELNEVLVGTVVKSSGGQTIHCRFRAHYMGGGN